MPTPNVHRVRRRAAPALAALAITIACRGSEAAPPLAEGCPAGASSPAMPAATFTGAAPFDALAFGLLARVDSIPGRNVVVSPASAGLALSLALEGASGATRDSLAAVLGFAGADTGEVTRRNAALVDALRCAPEVTLAVANAVWTRADLSFEPAFADRLRGAYRADIAALDLTSPEAVDRINAWARDATAGRIPIVLAEPLDARTAAVLTNAVYFKGRWASEFDPTVTTPRPFHRADGSVAPRPLMTRSGDVAYAAGEGFRVVRLPYRGERLAMYVALPDSGLAPAAARAQVTLERFRSAAAAVAPRPVVLALPRFRAECTAELAPAVAALGAASAFDPARAEFGRMLAPRDAARRLWLDRVVQRTFVEVNEEGTEAAAVTAGVMVDSSAPAPPIAFVVDRPFLFAIRDDHTGAILFLGWIADPAGQCGG
jgi:serpin B